MSLASAASADREALLDPTVETMLARLRFVIADLISDKAPERESHRRVRAPSSDGTLETNSDDASRSADTPDVPLALRISPLTDAEERILRYLPTHLTYPEIAAELYLSRHTVKSHVISIYRKLGVSSRGEAVQVARQLGYLTRFVALPTTPR